MSPLLTALDCPTYCHPVPVEEVEGVTVHAFRCSSLHTLEILDGDKCWMVGFRIKRQKQEVIFIGPKFQRVPLQ